MPNTLDMDSSENQSKTQISNFVSDAGAFNERILIREVDPKRCKPWKFHNRDTAWLTKERCKDLIHSIQKNGQIESVLVRQIKNDPNYDFEIIYGVRRWFACSQIPNQKLLVRVTEENDKACMILMHTENGDSKDISEFERAFSFAQQLRSGVFKNQTEMAKAIGITQGLISRMIRAAELFDYDWIRALFQNKLEIKVKPAYKLASMLKDSSKAILIKKVAQEIQAQINNHEQFPPKKILKKLLTAVQPEPEKDYSKKREVIYSLGKEQTISCKRDASGKVVLVFDNSARSIKREALMEVIKNAVDRFVLT